MATHKKTRLNVSWTIGGICSPPFAEGESDTVRWLRVQASDVMPKPYRDVRLRFELRANSWLCTGLFLLTEDALTAQELAERFPFAKLASEAAEGLATITDTKPPRVTAPRRRGRHGNSEEFLSEVAELYRFACQHPEYEHAPVSYLRSNKDLWQQGHEPHVDTVRNWLRQARKRGLLGPSIPGKAGEAAPSTTEGAPRQGKAPAESREAL